MLIYFLEIRFFRGGPRLAGLGHVDDADNGIGRHGGHALGTVVRQLPDKVRQDWANSLAKWPAQLAKDLDAKGLPASLVLETALKAAEDNGHKWPLRYGLK